MMKTGSGAGGARGFPRATLRSANSPPRASSTPAAEHTGRRPREGHGDAAARLHVHRVFSGPPRVASGPHRPEERGERDLSGALAHQRWRSIDLRRPRQGRRSLARGQIHQALQDENEPSFGQLSHCLGRCGIFPVPVLVHVGSGRAQDPRARRGDGRARRAALVARQAVLG